MKRPIITPKRLKIGSVVLAVFLALLLGIGVLASGLFGEVLGGGGIPGGWFEELFQESTHQ